MKFGVRTPSLKKSFKARTTGKIKRIAKSSINPVYGKKGMGLINDPKKSVYNKIYNKTTLGVKDIVKPTTYKNKKQNKVEEEILELIEKTSQKESFQKKLKEELEKNGYTMDDFNNAINSLNETPQDEYNDEEQMKFCKYCGEKTGETKEKIGEQNSIINNSIKNANVTTVSKKNKWISLCLCLFLGFLGAHKFYEGNMKMGLLYLFTCGLFGLGWLLDSLIALIEIFETLITKEEKNK